MNILERAIQAVSPGWALSRARTRVAAAAMTAYASAETGRRNGDWKATRQGPNEIIGSKLGKLQARSHQLVRDNPYADRAVSILTAHRVGAGITGRADTGNDFADEAANELWQEFIEVADLSSPGGFGAVQEMAARTWAEGGDGVVRIVRCSAAEMRERRLPVPFQLEALESEMMDDSSRPLPGGGAIVNGVELDRRWRRAGYWMRRSSLGGASAEGANLLDRWAVEDVMHVYTRKRPSQMRGVPIFAGVAERAYKLDGLEDAAMDKARIEACLAAFITSPAPVSQSGLMNSLNHDGGVPVDQVRQFRPGMIGRLQPGESVEAVQPSGEGQFSELALHYLMSIAIGTGVTYDQLTGDLRQANFSSLRAGKIEFRNTLEQDHWIRLIPVLCQPVWNAVMDAGVALGRLPPRRGGYRAQWMPPVQQMIDPAREVPMLRLMRRMGLATWSQQTMAQGWDPKQQAHEIARENELFDDLGLILDGDPRRTSLAGGAQDAKQNAAIEIGATGAALPRQGDGVEPQALAMMIREVVASAIADEFDLRELSRDR
jgi:lambda family phage portal protein